MKKNEKKKKHGRKKKEKKKREAQAHVHGTCGPACAPATLTRELTFPVTLQPMTNRSWADSS